MCTQAQKVTYTYDSGGSRTLKKVVIIQAGAKATAGIFEEEETTDVRKNVAAEGEITLNVTDGSKVAVCIPDALWQGEATLTMHDSAGRQVETMNITTQNTTADLGKHPSGIYMLTVKTGRRTKTWRIGIQ